MKLKVDFDKNSMSNIGESEILQKAKMYAEGSEEMEELLMFLWNNNISTIDCCSGQNEKENVEQKLNPFISIDASCFSEKELKDILSMLLTFDDVSKIKFSNGKNAKAKEEKSLTIEVQNKPDAIRAIHGIIYDAILKIASFDLAYLNKQDKLFVQNVIALNSASIDDINLSGYKKYYKALPEKLESASISRTKNGINYDVQLSDCGIQAAIGREVSYVCNSAYTKLPNEYCLMTDDKSNANYVSENKVKKLGLIEINNYLKLKHELFEKDSVAFNNMLKSKPQAQPQSE